MIRSVVKSHHVLDQGFTLIENMVALAIFAIGITAIVYLLLNGIGLSRSSQSLTGAYIGMQEMAAMIRADGGEALQYNGVNTAVASSFPSTSYPIADSNVASWANTLAELPGAPGTGKGGYGTITVYPTLWATPGQCPCWATITVYWANGDSYAVQTIVGY
jgi:type IV pilus assembly protein PilV